jgi:UDPglucose--hexose-1-phosphate uridylyltransferase
MSELRFNRISGDWVVIAADGRKPEDLLRREGQSGSDLLQARVRRKLDSYAAASHVAECPFCPGNEGLWETIAVRERRGSWSVRLVSHNGGLLSPRIGKEEVTDGTRRRVSGFGYHEVLIEHPEHNRWLWTQSPEQVAEVVEMMRRRYAELGEDGRVELVVPFKNHGRSAGTALLHPHSQIVGMPIMAADIRRRLSDAGRFYEEHGHCLFCEVIDEEASQGLRLVHQTSEFVSFIPYGALSPFHILVFPVRHSSDFGQLDESAVADFASHLRTLLDQVDARLLAPDFNFVIRSVLPDRADSRSFHWYMSVIPHVSGGSGLAMGSGMFINALAPEDSAAFLRVTAPQPSSVLEPPGSPETIADRG